MLVKINSILFPNAKVCVFPIFDYTQTSFSNNNLHLLACECDPEGSTELNCNADGICSCKDNVEGDQCKACKPGYYQHPNCLGKLAPISLKASK